jgi:hypothetical protein
MKITKHKKYGYTYKKFKGRYVRGICYDEDGSGELEVHSPKGYVRCGNYYEDSATHKDRVEDIKRLAEIYTNAYRELMELEGK